MRLPSTILALALGLPGLVLGYAVPIHELMPGRALASEPALAEKLPAVTPGQLDAFRMWLDDAFRAHPDAAVRARYVQRYPTPAAFTARAFKRLMSLNDDLPQNGFDRAQGLPCTALEALRLGSAQADTDWRNRERIAHDDQGRPMKLSDGRDVPADPLILNFGSVRGLSSQAHAHYALTSAPLSSDPQVFRSTPWLFALPAGWPAGPVRAFGRENCQLHYDLGVLALLWGDPAGRALGHLFLGHGMHYLEDVGNQIHTVQIGHYDLLKKAKFLYWQRALITLGGYLADLKPWTRVGIELVTTHHVLSENLNAKRVLEAVAGKPVPPVIQEVLAGLTVDDPELVADFAKGVPAAAPGPAPRPARAAALLGCVVERSCREGGEVYRHMAGALDPRMARYGVLVDSEDVDPDAALGPGDDPEVAAHLDALYHLHARAYRRVGTALRRLYAAFAEDSRAATPEDRARRVRSFADALLVERLDMLDGEAARLAQYLRDPPRASAPSVHEPIFALWPLVPIALLLLLRRRRLQRGVN